MRDTLTLLHLSDLQFGRNHRFGNLQTGDPDAKFDTLFSRLSDDISVLEGQGVRPELVIVSGDLAETGSAAEFDDAEKFVCELADRLKLGRSRFAIVPGNHDINRKLSEGYALTCEGEGVVAHVPFAPKWKNYRKFFERFYAGESDIDFRDDRPWTGFEIDDLHVYVAGFNSTIAESHQATDHYGWLGEQQLRWFAQALPPYADKGWLRIGLVHHNVVRAAKDDEENLRDAVALRRLLGPSLNLILHGHTHEDDLNWADTNVPIISTGSAALKAAARPPEMSNQYQALRLSPTKLERWTRRYDPPQKRWVGDTRCSPGGDDWHFSKAVSFAGVHGTFRSVDVERVEAESGATRIVQVDKPLDADAARAKLKHLPRFRLTAEKHHLAVRKVEQRQFADVVANQRGAWLVADWGAGKDGFLGSALHLFGGDKRLSDVFRLQSGGIETCEQLVVEAETQLGMSFQEFLAAVAVLPFAAIVFDDLSANIASGPQRPEFEKKVRPIFDFCPQLRLICITRLPPSETLSPEVTLLRPLDISETRSYLRLHPKAITGIDDPDQLERIHDWSGGLPMHLDRLLDRSRYLPIREILDEDIDIPADVGEPLPESLRKAVLKLAVSEIEQSRRSFRLLKVLTVLRDGETFQSIKRFYSGAPFHQANVDELVALGLLEDVPISQTAADLNVGFGRTPAIAVPKLLRVPRQVRDHVNSLIDEIERSAILNTSTQLFFGPKWFQGRVRLRTALANAYGHSAIAGPGNEHLVARYLLVRALEQRNKRQITRYVALCLTYCHKLLAADRFRDAVIAAGTISDLLTDTDLTSDFLDAAHMYARALRMIGKEAETVTILESALERGAGVLIDTAKAGMLLTLALAYEDLRQNDDAIKAARKVLDLVHQHSDEAYQAKSVIARLSLREGKLKAELITLEADARNRGQTSAANNIALDLAKESVTVEESIGWLDKVIFTARDPYNLTRAIVEKMTVLGAHVGTYQLRERDRQLLNAAYSYSYSQRIGNLLDRCHSVLWRMFTRDRLWASVLRLFRFSSFIWRLRGKEDREAEYLLELKSLDIESVKNETGETLRTEIVYLQLRRQDQALPQQIAEAQPIAAAST
jgi:3',5'-cyclic AMP phosphodiesterase CpdA/tetratricopeptide (TPR) repeat protein